MFFVGGSLFSLLAKTEYSRNVLLPQEEEHGTKRMFSHLMAIAVTAADALCEAKCPAPGATPSLCVLPGTHRAETAAHVSNPR